MPQEIIVTVFGSSRPGEGSPDYEEACVLGRALAKHGFAVCSGGYGGVMEAVSRGAKQVGGKTYGVTAEFFKSAKLNRWIDVEVRKQTWEERLFEKLRDRKSTRLNSSHSQISYAVFCLKKKNRYSESQ